MDTYTVIFSSLLWLVIVVPVLYLFTTVGKGVVTDLIRERTRETHFAFYVRARFSLGGLTRKVVFVPIRDLEPFPGELTVYKQRNLDAKFYTVTASKVKKGVWWVSLLDESGLGMGGYKLYLIDGTPGCVDMFAQGEVFVMRLDQS